MSLMSLLSPLKTLDLSAPGTAGTAGTSSSWASPAGFPGLLRDRAHSKGVIPSFTGTLREDHGRNVRPGHRPRGQTSRTKARRTPPASRSSSGSQLHKRLDLLGHKSGHKCLREPNRGQTKCWNVRTQ